MTKSATRRGRGLAKKTIGLIDAIREIAREIQPCSVRAIAYQLFNRKLIPSMAKNSTQQVSRLCTIARERELLPWEWIVDTTRAVDSPPSWDDPEDFARSVMRAYRIDKWRHQPTYVIVLSEKSTVEGTIRPVLRDYEVPFLSVHGFGSATAIMDLAQAALDRDQPTLILYIGDYDPSGMYMSEVDLVKRFARYSGDTPADKDVPLGTAREALGAIGVAIKRVALTEADTAALGSGPRFPASDKSDDARHDWFVANHGHWCWELDAMSPNDLRRRLDQEVFSVLDTATWDRWTHTEKVEHAGIVELCQGWNSILRPDRK
jgi:hypothetical protein